MSETLLMLPSPEPKEPDHDPEKPWKGICCKRCWKAKSEKKKCKCRCHGENHGNGYISKLGISDHDFPSIPHYDPEDNPFGEGSPFETRP